MPPGLAFPALRVGPSLLALPAPVSASSSSLLVLVGPAVAPGPTVLLGAFPLRVAGTAALAPMVATPVWLLLPSLEVCHAPARVVVVVVVVWGRMAVVVLALVLALRFLAVPP